MPPIGVRNGSNDGGGGSQRSSDFMPNLTSLPTVTAFIIAFNIVCFIGEELYGAEETMAAVALGVRPVWGHGLAGISRLYTYAFFHVGIFHLLMNMLSGYWLMKRLEHAFGSLVLLGQVLLFPPMTGLLYTGIQAMNEQVIRSSMNLGPNDALPIRQDSFAAEFVSAYAVGFSGVLFAMLVVETMLAFIAGERVRRLYCLPIPTFTYPYVLLLIISLIFPGVSFLGHLVGIFVGSLYCRGLFLPCSFSRPCIRWIESRLPSWLVRLPGWVALPEPNAVEPLHLECIRSMRRESGGRRADGSVHCCTCCFGGGRNGGFRCPAAPNVDGVSCMMVLNLFVAFRDSVRRAFSSSRQSDQSAGGGRVLGTGSAGTGASSRGTTTTTNIAGVGRSIGTLPAPPQQQQQPQPQPRPPSAPASLPSPSIELVSVRSAPALASSSTASASPVIASSSSSPRIPSPSRRDRAIDADTTTDPRTTTNNQADRDQSQGQVHDVGRGGRKKDGERYARLSQHDDDLDDDGDDADGDRDVDVEAQLYAPTPPAALLAVLADDGSGAGESSSTSASASASVFAPTPSSISTAIAPPSSAAVSHPADGTQHAAIGDLNEDEDLEAALRRSVEEQ